MGPGKLARSKSVLPNVCQNKDSHKKKGATNFPTADKIDGKQKFLRKKIVIK